MKKLLISIFVFFITCPFVNAANCLYSCVEPYDLSNGALRFVSTVTGSKFIAEQFAEAILEKEICKNIEGKINVNITSYSLPDLKKGIFKTIDIKGKNLDSNGIEFKSIKLKSMCDFNYISLANPNKPVFKEVLALGFNIEMTEENLNSAMQTEDYKRVISDMNRLGGGLGVVKIVSTSIKIKDDKIFYIMKVALPFVKATQNLVFVTDLKINRGQIDFANTKLVSESIVLDLRKIDRIINFLNPLDFSFNLLENKDVKLTIQNAKIEDNKVYTSGLIVIQKDEG